MAKTKSQLKPKPRPKAKTVIISRKTDARARTRVKAKQGKREQRISSLGIENIPLVQLQRKALLDKAESEKETREKTLFHKYWQQVAGCVVALYMIIYFFAPPGWSSYMDVVFFSGFLIAALVLADFFYRHEHKPHDAAIILGLFFLPPLLTVVIFFKFWAMVVLALMAWALISALIIYYEHKKGRHLTEVMWVSVYSHLLAFSAAIVLFALLSYINPARFMSEMAMILTYSLPPIFIHFFISHYMYVHHFDSKHPRQDLFAAVKHALWFTLILFLVIAALDVGVNARSFRQTSDDYAQTLKFDMETITGMHNSMDDAPDHIRELPIHQEVRAYTYDLQSSTIIRELALANRRISILDFIDDSYLDLESEMRRNDLSRYLEIAAIKQAKEWIDRSDPAAYWERISKDDVTAAYLPQAALNGYDAVRVALSSGRISPSRLDSEILPALDSLVGSEEVYLSDLLRNSFRFGSSYFFERVNAVMLSSKLYLFTVRETSYLLVELPHDKNNQGLWRSLARNMDIEEPVASKQLRYELLMMAGQSQREYLNPAS